MFLLCMLIKSNLIASESIYETKTCNGVHSFFAFIRAWCSYLEMQIFCNFIIRQQNEELGVVTCKCKYFVIS